MLNFDSLNKTHPILYSCSKSQISLSWDQKMENEFCTLSSDLKTVYFFDGLESKGTIGIRSSTPVNNGFYYEIILKESLFGTSVMFGLGTQDVCMFYKDYNYVNLIGLDRNAWGLSHKGTVWHDGKYRKFCEPFYDKDTKIGVLYYDKKIHYFINDVYKGVAFENVDTNNRKLYPMVSSTAADIELEFGNAFRLNYSLQDLCIHKVFDLYKTSFDQLPLPRNLILSLNQL